MLSLKTAGYFAAACAGVALGASAWLAFGGKAPQVQLDQLTERLSRAEPPALQQVTTGPISTTPIISNPIFVLTTGPGAIAEAVLRLDGISRSAARSAALIGIGAKPSAWLRLGETRDGVTLTEVSPGGVVVDTPTGFKSLKIGDVESPAAANADPSQAGTQ